MDRCDSCGKTGDNLKKCVQCESVMYCNKDCQRAAWKIHRKACHPNPAAATAANAASVDALTNAVAGSSLGDATKKEYTDHVICQYCGVDASAKRLNCSKCKNTHYCSRECQVSFTGTSIYYKHESILCIYTAHPTFTCHFRSNIGRFTSRGAKKPKR
jgi:hypothetical protein